MIINLKKNFLSLRLSLKSLLPILSLFFLAFGFSLKENDSTIMWSTVIQ